ncbi:MAG: hypothetical protein C4291_09940 [Candidatus Dadabacteria bacterium]
MSNSLPFLDGVGYVKLLKCLNFLKKGTLKRRIEIHSNLRLSFPDALFEFHLIHTEKFPFYRKMANEMVEV